MGKGFGFGKTILVGDAFVQFGVPAIVAAIEHGTTAIIHREPGSGWNIEDLRPEIEGYKRSKLKQQRESIERMIKTMGIDLSTNRIKIILKGDLIAGSGIGASAASCVAIASALNDEFGLLMSKDGINQLAFEGEKAYHGDPGGIDNTVSTYGGILWFQKNLLTQKDLVERIKGVRILYIVLASSGVNVDTIKVVEYKKEQFKNHPEKFNTAFQISVIQAIQLRRSLEKGYLDDIGHIMDEHHQILRELDFSHEKIETIIKIAREEGALGAKVTGGGMGGYVLILARDRLHQEKIANAIEERGFRILKTRILS